ncbi:protein-tyrosine-phosphatase [Gramella sp. GC03-9]|uniref:Protein-tyrosine-phosphatase n=1 Tax=Christiangramia oceanisediminis TaxID=2920386 RepID=A0A9X2KZG7_9FLAO|nr:protein-tyrosine-phosphatase [Gramella oceanisediminis]MCP9201001.1 protein-tyrosine-phosphatase [Gramella oceanisediminis]
MTKNLLFPELKAKLQQLNDLNVPEERKKVLQPLIDYIQKKKNSGETILLNFICTHNSRRSQLAQVWAQAISAEFGIETKCYSGGTEKTAFFENAIKAVDRAGFRIDLEKGENPNISVTFSESEDALICYSKVYDAPENPSGNFAAVMTCSHADENCPFIPGAEARIALDYQDPKEFDGTPLASQKYDERSDQIASEMIYVFKNIH